jgi:2-iminobutanoate/2-iminopropanoate deaminase
MVTIAGCVLLTCACTSRQVRHFEPAGPKPAGVPANARAPFSGAVFVGDTLYLSGVTDLDPATFKPGTSPRASAKLVLDSLEQQVKQAGLSMDDLVWVQVFATDLATFNDFGAVYAGYFHGDLPARSFVGVAGLMGGAHFEVNAIAARRPR